MAIGKGKYDDLCTLVREKAQAEGAIVIVFGGNSGPGFSAQLPTTNVHMIASMLRLVARDIENADPRDFIVGTL